MTIKELEDILAIYDPNLTLVIAANESKDKLNDIDFIEETIINDKKMVILHYTKHQDKKL